MSSTLSELAAERAAVRLAVERLHLTPVMFELGARPHAPRALYRAYLAQSHVFVGIYWQRYGWIAPGESISGLEDEYRLAGARPRLLYIKEPAPEAEPRLLELINDFASDDLASFKKFGSAAELSDLVANDLALLLTERFEESLSEPPSPVPSHVPMPAYQIVNRDQELRDIVELLRSGSRLVTLTGIGGVGKTRLAVEVARRLGDEFHVTYVGLSTVTEADEAVRAIAEAVRIRAEGTISRVDAIADHLRGATALLVLDNAEQISGLGAVLGQLLETAPDVQMLVTSRRALRIRAEREVRVAPLALPRSRLHGESMDNQPAIRLFVDRAAAVGQTIDADGTNAGTLVEISHRLEGIPLAIELAAAWTRMFSPQQLLERLQDPLTVLVGGSADAPERQQTMRATIEWSYNLLDDAERALLGRLSVFVSGWTIEAANAVCGSDDFVVTETLSALLDASLVTAQGGVGATPRFTMFEPVRSFSAERLEAAGERALLSTRHLDYYCDLAARAQPALCGYGQRQWIERLEPERADLRQAIEHALIANRHSAVVELAWDVIVLYFVLDAVDEVASWLKRVIDARPALDDVTFAKLRSLHALTEVHAGRYEGVAIDLSESLRVFREAEMDFETAVTLHQIGFVTYHVHRDPAGAIAALRESSALFDGIDHDWGVALVETMLASVFSATDQLTCAADCASRALSRARTIDNQPLTIQALHQLAFVRLLEGSQRDAFRVLDESAALLRRNSLRTEASYCLDALALVALIEGDTTNATLAAARAAFERSRLGVAPWPTLVAAIERVAESVKRRIAPLEHEQTQQVADQDLFEVLEAVRERVRTLLARPGR